MEGFFERMIQNAKRCLRKTLRNAKLDYDELQTLHVEVEGTLNSIETINITSSDDVEEPLTPFHLIYGRGILSLPEVTPGREASLSQAASCNDGPLRGCLRKNRPLVLLRKFDFSLKLGFRSPYLVNH